MKRNFISWRLYTIRMNMLKSKAALIHELSSRRLLVQAWKVWDQNRLITREQRLCRLKSYFSSWFKLTNVKIARREEINAFKTRSITNRYPHQS